MDFGNNNSLIFGVYAKAKLPSWVRFVPLNFTCDSFGQSPNAPSSIVVTEEGIFTDFKFWL